jgi:hypothetical protein
MQHDRETIENLFTLARNNLFRRRSVIPVTTRNQVERAGKNSTDDLQRKKSSPFLPNPSLIWNKQTMT